MNSTFEMQELDMEGVKLITPFYMEDDRGFFLKSVERDIYRQWGLNADIYEDFESYSTKGVIRGLHFQLEKPQTKIVRVIKGAIRDVIVDLRKDSETYGKWVGVILSERNMKQMYISEGFAHGFKVLSDTAKFCYKVTDFYHPNDEGGIAWNDPDIGIEWPEPEIEPVLSDKDTKWPHFKDIFVNV